MKSSGGWKLMRRIHFMRKANFKCALVVKGYLLENRKREDAEI